MDQRRAVTCTRCPPGVEVAVGGLHAPTDAPEVRRGRAPGRGGRAQPRNLRHLPARLPHHVAPARGSLRVREVTTPVVDRVLMVMKRESTAIARAGRTIVAGIMRYARSARCRDINPVREVARIEGTPKRRPRALTAEERRQWLDAVENSDAAQRWDLPDDPADARDRVPYRGVPRVGVDGGGSRRPRRRTSAGGWCAARASACCGCPRPSPASGGTGLCRCRSGRWTCCVSVGRRSVPGCSRCSRTLWRWRDPNNVRRVWREVRDQLAMDGLVSHTLRKTVASFLDDANVTTRRISDQLGHAQVSMTQDRYLGRRLTDRQTADVLEGIIPGPDSPVSSKGVPKGAPAGCRWISPEALTCEGEPAPGFEPGTARLQVGCAASCAMPAGRRRASSRGRRRPSA